MDNKFTMPLEAEKSALLLIDYQAKMFWGASSKDTTLLKNNVMALASGAQILGVPTVLTSIGVKINGVFLPEITGMFPNVSVINRNGSAFDAFEDKGVFDTVKKTGRKQLVLSGLWTSMCMAFTALRALREGFDVFGVMDTAADYSVESDRMAVKRMVQAGVVPCSWMQVISEWMHDWQNPKAGELVKNVYQAYNGYFGQKGP